MIARLLDQRHQLVRTERCVFSVHSALWNCKLGVAAGLALERNEAATLLTILLATPEELVTFWQSMYQLANLQAGVHVTFRLQVMTDWLRAAPTATPLQACVPDLNAPVEYAFSLVKAGLRNRDRAFFDIAAGIGAVLGQRNRQAVHRRSSQAF